MSREIKFRVWNKKHKILVESGKGIGYCNFDIDMSGRITREILGDLCMRIDRSTTENQENYVVQQLTGLKDHSGNDIYEGDIIDLCYSKGHERDSSYDYDGKYVVEFKNGGWKLIFQNCFHGDEQIDLDLWLESSEYLKEQGMEEFKIIGNVFDNPELLTK